MLGSAPGFVLHVECGMLISGSVYFQKSKVNIVGDFRPDHSRRTQSLRA